ncbi:immunoglobulin-like domain-containing protein [Paenibacillus sp. sgz5001063]|uniref:immunoglobulin-like domain-containing protein n=1 Tax=Paenibacillus sp. sgz5001063 TaxID=3242474 RepID=UPI0036D2C99A
MLKKRNIRFCLSTSIAAALLWQSLAIPTAYGSSAAALTPQGSAATASTGKWMSGEYHAHTYESNDAQESLKDVLDNAFDKNGLDWLFLADHLRVSDRDDEGIALPGGSIPMSQGIAAYQTPIIKQLQAGGKYAGKIIFSGFEWDMPQYDHAAVGLVTDNPGSEAALKAINQFEYLFTNRDAKLFSAADVAAWSAADSRAYSTKADTRTGIQWLSDHYPESYLLINHPSRKNGSSAEIKIADVRDFNNIDPHVVFGLEGMLGNQMAPDRGETVDVYGGTDVKVAKVGGFWDALLGEGRRFWNFANSDFHFKTSRDNKYSSGYWPGEYSRNYTWVDGTDIQAVVDGMRSGKSFSVFGDLINALDFELAADGKKEETGGELEITEGDNLELTIRFKSPGKNNNGDPVQVDHVDLISGEVSGKAVPGTPEYNKATNDSTKVVARFTSKDWTTDAEGYNVITYKLGTADKNRYYRLRGTNLGVNVPGETSNGEPLLDAKNLTVDNAVRFAEINKRNYQDLWFYSNPIFVNVAPYSDKQAVEDTEAALDLGNISAVTADLKLPAEGEHGALVKWESRNLNVLRVENGEGLINRPAAGQPDASVLLTATVTRGAESTVKTFDLVIRALDYTDAEAVLLAKDKLTLGDTSAVTSDLYLPAAGEQGTSVTWESSSPLLMTHDGKLAFRPQLDTKLTLTATIRRGSAAEVKTFEVHLSGDASVTPLALSGTLQTGDGHAYLSGAWTNQNVTVSVYANVYVPGSRVSFKVHLDGGEGQPYEQSQPIKLTAEGKHQLELQAVDTLGNTASLPLAVNIDRTAPVISLKGSSRLTLTQGAGFVDPGTEITDKLGIAGLVKVTGTVDTQTPGIYTLRYNASDLAGNAALEVVRTVVVTASSSTGNGNGDGIGSSGSTPIRPVATPPATTVEKPPIVEVKVEVPAQLGGTGLLQGVASFSVPAGALSANATLTLKALAAKEAPASGQLQSLSPAVAFAASGESKLSKPVALSLAYDQGQITSGHKPAVYYYNEQSGNWIYVGGTQSPDGTITANTRRFATYAVMNYQPLVLADLSSHWATEYTDRLIGMGVMKGFGDQSFRPDEPVTRAQFASIITRALGLKPSGSAAEFADQSNIPAWAAGDVAAAVESGILKGYASGGKSVFRGSEKITRAEMAVMLSNALKTSPIEVSIAGDSLLPADQSAIPAWAQASVKAGMDAGILRGFEDNTFRPDKTATRAEAAAAVSKLLAAISI